MGPAAQRGAHRRCLSLRADSRCACAADGEPTGGMISQKRIPQRFVDRRRPQKAEQLVEVPTVVSFSSLEQQTAKQIIDIPLPRTRGCHGDLQAYCGADRQHSCWWRSSRFSP